MKKTLPIVLQKEYITYTDYGYPLCIILSDERLNSWFYKRFIQICAIHDKAGSHRLVYLENWDSYSEVIDITNIVSENILDPEKLVYDSINNDTYIIMHLNDYYLEPLSSYRNNHFIHRSLIYGYDITQGVYHAIAFDKRRKFSQLQYKRDEFIDSYVSACDPEKEIHKIIRLIRRKPHVVHNYDPVEFYEMLKSYYNSFSTIQTNNDEQVRTFGLNALKVYLVQLDMILQGNNNISNVFHNLHFIYEHKKGLLKRIKHFLSYMSFHNERILIERFQDIIDLYETARNLYIREFTNNINMIYTASYKVNIIKRIYELIVQGVDLEKEFFDYLFSMNNELVILRRTRVT